MLRQLAFIALLFLPAALYFAYAAWVRQRALDRGETDPPPVLANTPWLWLILLGVLLLGLALGIWAVLEGSPAGSGYVPARFEDGVILPGEFVPPADP